MTYNPVLNDKILKKPTIQEKKLDSTELTHQIHNTGNEIKMIS